MPKIPHAGRLPLFFGVALGLALAGVVGFKSIRHGRNMPRSSETGKTVIYKFLARQTKQAELKPLIDLELPDRVALLRSNVTVLDRRATAIRTSLRAAEGDATAGQKELDELRQEVQKRKRAATDAKAQLQKVENQVPVNPSELAAVRAETEQKQRAWLAQRDELAAKEARLGAVGQNKAAEVSPPLRAAEQELDAARQALRAKEEELGGQENACIRRTRQQASEAGSYEALYALIGQQLITADQLLANPDIERRRMGVSFAREACRHASAEAQNGWLAARIGQAYLWPHLDLADATPGSKEHAQDLLQFCRSVFTELGETNNVVRNYELMISHSPSRQGADSFRLNLAELLEQTGDYSGAAKCLREIQESNLVAAAQQSLTRLQPRLAPSR
jgi:hypothetical protein